MENSTNNNQEGETDMDNYDFQDDFNTKFKAEQQKLNHKPNVLMAGYTGSGKTSLALAILGDMVSDDKIGNGAPKTMGYDKYENEHICLWDSKGLELGETEEAFTDETREFVRQRQDDTNVDNHIHLVWYVIQGSGARVTDCDINLIKKIFNPENVIVVISKADITRPNQLEALRAKIIEAGIPAERIVATSDEEAGAEGCKELMELSYRILPAAYKDAFMEAQSIDMEAKIMAVYDKAFKAKGIVTTAAVTAGGIGATPIPIADAALLIPVQIGMIAALAALYGLKEEAIKHSALPFVGKVAGMFAVTSILKFIPGLGSAVSATVATVLTGAMGLYTSNSFEAMAIAKIKGEPIPEMPFDINKFNEFYKTYKQGINKE